MKHYRPFCFISFKQSDLARRARSVHRHIYAATAIAFLLGVTPQRHAVAQNVDPATTTETPMRHALRIAGEARARGDFATAMKWYREPAQIGDPVAQYQVGWMYGNGKGVPQDYRTAIIWYRKSAEQNFALAEISLAGLYFAGHGVRQDRGQAALWTRKAADQGLPVAQSMLGMMYEYGMGVGKDVGQAAAWFQKAALAGNDRAEFELGRMYVTGQGVPSDVGRGLELIRKAAAQENEDAQEYLRTAQTTAGKPAGEPSNDDVIALAKERLKRDALKEIADEYGDLDNLSSDPLSHIQGMAPKTARPILACSMNAPSEKDACINQVKSELMVERTARINALRNADMGTQFNFVVQSKTPYEGNYVALVNIRKRGTDTTYQWKLLLQPKGGAWVIAKKEGTQIQ